MSSLSKSKNLFVTGATGFLGSNFVNIALQRGHKITAIKRPRSKTRIPLEKEPDWIIGDLRDDFTEHLSSVDTLVHLAAHGVNPEKRSWEECLEWNVTLPVKLWQKAIASNVKRLVVCGSCFEYGKSGEKYDFIPSDAPLRPVGPYDVSKACASQAAISLGIEFNWEVVILRPFHVFGEGEADYRFWPQLKKKALEGSDFHMTEGNQVRDFVPVEAVAEAFMNAVESETITAGEPVVRNVGTGKPRKLADFAREQWKNFGGNGNLIMGTIKGRKNEIMRYVPKV